MSSKSKFSLEHFPGETPSEFSSKSSPYPLPDSHTFHNFPSELELSDIKLQNSTWSSMQLAHNTLNTIFPEDYRIIKLSRITRMIIAIKLGFAFLYMILYPYLFPLIILEILGYYSARSLNYVIGLIYLAFVSFELILRLIIISIVAVILNRPTNDGGNAILIIVLTSFSICALIDWVQISILFKFTSCLRDLSYIKRTEIIQTMRSKAIPCCRFT